MPTPKRKTARAAIDTVPLPEHTQRGKLARSGTGYVLTVGAKRIKFTASPILPASQLNKLVGKEVLVGFSEKPAANIVAIMGFGRGGIRPPRIICYHPLPDILRRIEDRLRQELLDTMVAEKIVPQNIAAELRSEMAARR